MNNEGDKDNVRAPHPFMFMFNNYSSRNLARSFLKADSDELQTEQCPFRQAVDIQ